MLRLAVFFLILFAIAAGFAWFADNPGTVTLQWPWLNGSEPLAVDLLVAIIALAVTIFAAILAWTVVVAILTSPRTFGRWREGKRRDKGYAALSQGLVAANAGNAPLARRLTKESSKHLDNEPLVGLLDAQTALLEDNHDSARRCYTTMLEKDETRLLGLRGLYLEAEYEGESEAAGHFAREAVKANPGTPWATQAMLRSQTAERNWEEALKTLDLNRSAGMFDKDEYSRKKAAILTALAMDEEDASPDKARSHALAAHKLVPTLAPAAVTAARLCTRLNDMRKAAKVLETTWKAEPHPDVADAYIHLRAGDSILDRLKRAETLDGKRSNTIDGQLCIAQVAIDASKYDTARDALEAAFRIEPTERACLLMADLEEAENTGMGRVREWLARAVHAPRDKAWVADGVVAEEWAPASPVTGEIDAFEWKQPVEQLALSGKTVDYTSLLNSGRSNESGDEMKTILSETVVTATATTVSGSADADDDAATGTTTATEYDLKTVEIKTEAAKSSVDDEIEDAVIIEATTKAEPDKAIEKPVVEQHEVRVVKAGGAKPEIKEAVEASAISEPTPAPPAVPTPEPEPVARTAPKPPVVDPVVDLEGVGSVTDDIVDEDSDSIPDNPTVVPVPANDAEKVTKKLAGEDGDKAEVVSLDRREGERKPGQADSPYKQRNLDPDNDGKIDHHPDDPGIDENDAPPKRGLFGRG